MKNLTQNNLLPLIENASMDIILKNKFISRIQKGNLTRDENPTSHLCIFFAGFDPSHKQVFIGKHIKSGLWLFNGGHIDRDESLEDARDREMREEWGVVHKIDTHSPSFFTLKQIDSPNKQPCKWHYDIWYFIPLDKNIFHPNEKLLSQEFYEWGWKTITEAKYLTNDDSTLKGISFIESTYFN